MESMDKTLQLHTVNTMVVLRKSTGVTDLQVRRLVLLEILFLGSVKTFSKAAVRRNICLMSTTVAKRKYFLFIYILFIFINPCV